MIEEDSTSLETPLSAGLHIARMSVQSTSRNWKSGFRERRAGENLFKLLGLEGASIYWDSGTPLADPPSSLKELLELLRRRAEAPHAFVLSPVSAAVRMEKNASKFPLKTLPLLPRFLLQVEPGGSAGVSLELSQRQLREMRLLSREWARYDRGRQHRKWRPREPCTGAAKAWWNFAAQVELDRIRRERERSSWAFAGRRARQAVAYASAYRRRLALLLAEANAALKASVPVPVEEQTDGEAVEESPSSESSTLSDTDKILLKQIERDPDYTYEELQILRDAVFRRLIGETRGKKEEAEGAKESEPEDWDELNPPSSSEMPSPMDTPRTEQPAGGGLYGWLSSWWGGGGEAEDDDDATEADHSELDRVLGTERELSAELKAKEAALEESILDVLNESWDDSTLLRRDSLLARIYLRLKSVRVTLVEEAGKEALTRVLAGTLTGALGCLELSPRHNSLRFQLRLQDFSLCSEEMGRGKDELRGERESLFWSPEMATTLALGKAAESGESAGAPLLALSYQRRVAKFLASHTLQATFAPISLMYQADALDKLNSFFRSTLPGSDFAAESPQEEGSSMATMTPDIYQTEVRAELTLPALHAELRSDLSLGESAGGGGKAFAVAHLRQGRLVLERKEPHSLLLHLTAAGLEVKTNLRPSQWPISAKGVWCWSGRSPTHCFFTSPPLVWRSKPI